MLLLFNYLHERIIPCKLVHERIVPCELLNAIGLAECLSIQAFSSVTNSAKCILIWSEASFKINQSKPMNTFLYYMLVLTITLCLAFCKTFTIT